MPSHVRRRNRFCTSDATTHWGDNSCNGIDACLNVTGDVGDNSCIGPSACQDAGNVGDCENNTLEAFYPDPIIQAAIDLACNDGDNDTFLVGTEIAEGSDPFDADSVPTAAAAEAVTDDLQALLDAGGLNTAEADAIQADALIAGGDALRDAGFYSEAATAYKKAANKVNSIL